MATDMNDYFNMKKKSGGNGGGSNNNNSGGGNFNAPQPPNLNFGGGKAAIFYVIGALVLFLVVAKPFVTIHEGERGIKATYGKYESNALLPGLHFIWPLIQKVYIVDTKVRIINYAERLEKAAKEGDGIIIKPAITVLDKRGLPVSIELTVQYRLNAMYAAQTISKWGFTWEEKIINPVVRDIVRNVVGNYDAESLPTKRNAIAAEIETGIRNSVESQQNSPALFQSVQLREIILPQRVKDQIERVQIARQEVQRAEQEVQRTKQEALKRAAEAEGKANAIKIAAQGQANAIRIEAEAKAEANKMISESLTEQLLVMEQIKVQGQFNNALRVNSDAKIFLTPGGSTPNIWVDMKDPQRQSAIRNEQR